MKKSSKFESETTACLTSKRKDMEVEFILEFV